MNKLACLALVAIGLLISSPITATTIVSPSEDEMVVLSDVIALGAVVRIESLETTSGAFKTYITLAIEKRHKGLRRATRVVLRQPGGWVGGRGQWIFGSPSYRVGERVLVFLRLTPDGVLETNHLGLGKYRVSRDASGREMVERNMNGTGVHFLGERPGELRDRRPLAELEKIIRDTVATHGEQAVPAASLYPRELDTLQGLTQLQEQFTFLGNGARWFEPDTGGSVSYLVDSTGQTDITGGGFTEVNRALEAWTSVSSSSITLVNGGATTPSPFGSCDDVDSKIVFNDPFGEIADPGGSCSGTLAVGGVCFTTSETTTVNGKQFNRIITGDVLFANGFGGCTFWTATTFAEVAAHEIGHTIGLGHSSENPSEEDCSLSEATMYFRVSADGRGASASTLLKNDDIIGASFIYPAATPAKIYVLDAHGGVHRGGSAASLSPATPYFGFDAAMDIEFNAAGTGYYVLDRFGGVHAGGAATVISPPTPYFGFDVAGDMALKTDGTGYYVLDRFGGVHQGGAAPLISPATPYFGFDIARSLKLSSGETGYYVLDGFGGVHRGGTAPSFSFNPTTPYFGFDIAADLELAPNGAGLYVLDGFGGVHRAGCPPILRPIPPYFGFDIAADLAILPGGAGGFVLDALGGVHRLGTASTQTPATPYFGFAVARAVKVVP